MLSHHSEPQQRSVNIICPKCGTVGVVLWEGLGEASGNAWDTRTDDIDVAAQEARTYGDERYGEWWGSPDGIRRDLAFLRTNKNGLRASLE